MWKRKKKKVAQWPSEVSAFSQDQDADVADRHNAKNWKEHFVYSWKTALNECSDHILPIAWQLNKVPMVHY